MRSRIDVPITTMRPIAAPSSRYTAIGSAKTVAASGNETPCFAKFHAALAEFHSKSPSTMVAMANVSMGYNPYIVKQGCWPPRSGVSYGLTFPGTLKHRCPSNAVFSRAPSRRRGASAGLHSWATAVDATSCRRYGTQPGEAAACRIHVAICASSRPSSWMSIQRASSPVPPGGTGSPFACCLQMLELKRRGAPGQGRGWNGAWD